jgi:uncharacterized protein (TIGR02996 family)
MSEQASLLLAVCEHPEDAPRLVSADWLDDHGDPALADSDPGGRYTRKPRGKKK